MTDTLFDGLAPLGEAIRMIASRCDGAQSRDGAGFDGQDTWFGKAIAVVPVDDWTPDIAAEVHRCLRKYRTQLADGGIDYDALPVPAGANESARADRDARQQAYALRRRTAGRAKAGLKATEPGKITVEDGALVVAFDYNADLVAAVKGLTGRRFDGTRKVWHVPASQAAAAIAALPGFTVHADVTALAATMPPAAAQRRIEARTDGQWAVFFPFDQSLLAAIRAVPSAKWVKDAGCWLVKPSPAAARALLGFLEYGFETGIELVTLAGDAVALAEASRALDGAIPDAVAALLDELQHELRPFQQVGVAYAVEARRTFICDEMGGGKTMTGLASIHAAGAYPAYIAVPAKLRTNWAREALKWLPAGTRVAVVLPPSAGRRAQDRLRAKGIIPMLGQPQPGAADIYVTGYPLLHTQLDAVRAVAPHALILDESHYCKTQTRKKVCPECAADMTKANVCKGPDKHVVAARQQTKRYKVLATFGAHAVARMIPDTGLVLCLTGTPNKNTTADFVAQLDILGRLDDFGGEWGFYRRYCGAYQDKWGRWNIDGTSNEVELNDRLRSICYVRRTKEQVLPELPPLDRRELLVDLPDDQRAAYDRVEDDFLTYLADRARTLALEAGADAGTADKAAWEKRLRAEAAEHLVRVSTLRQAAALAKIDLAGEWVEDFLTGTDRKLIVFAHHVPVVEALAEKFGCDRIDGSTAGDTDEIVERFQTDPNARLLVIGIMAGGVGLTLTAASDMLFLEQAWTPADLDQAEARCYGRLNDAHGATATYMLGDSTFDEDMWALITAKRATFHAVADGTPLAGEQGNVLGDLLVRLAERGLARANDRRT